jgi:trigger factor
VLEGLDEAVTGLSAGDSTTFRGVLAGGESEGEEADVTVTVHSVKVKEMPEIDDSFAQLASEFDTLGELRAATRRQMEQMRRMQQANQARDRALEALLSSVDFPMPEGYVQHELQHSNESVNDQLKRGGMTLPEYLSSVGQTAEQFSADLEQQARRSVKAGLLLDEVARAEELNVTQQDLEYYITEQAQRYGVPPDRLAQQLVESGQINAAAGEVLRGKALSVVAERAKVTDEAGHGVDIKALVEEISGAPVGEADEVDEVDVVDEADEGSTED